MPVITLSDAAFQDLKSLAEPFVDTPESLTARLIHEEVVRRREAGVGSNAPLKKGQMLVQSPVAHESLAHTRLVSASVGGEEMHRPKWNGLLVKVHVLALQRLGSHEALQQASKARMRVGRYEEDGYKFLEEAGFSIQGVDANLAWDHSMALARQCRIGLRAEFEWRDKEGAAHPGQRGLLEWAPAAQVSTPRLARPEQAREFRKQVQEVSADAQV
jgi:hypothetical protein